MSLATHVISEATNCITETIVALNAHVYSFESSVEVETQKIHILS